MTLRILLLLLLLGASMALSLVAIRNETSVEPSTVEDRSRSTIPRSRRWYQPAPVPRWPCLRATCSAGRGGGGGAPPARRWAGRLRTTRQPDARRARRCAPRSAPTRSGRWTARSPGRVVLDAHGRSARGSVSRHIISVGPTAWSGRRAEAVDRHRPSGAGTAALAVEVAQPDRARMLRT
jgi:hypothetical protein